MPSHSCSIAPDHRLVGDPVDTLTGAVSDRKLEFRLTGPLELWWYRHYDSAQNRRCLGLGWGQTHDFDRTLRFDRNRLLYESPVGRVFGFPVPEKDGDDILLHGLRLLKLSPRRYQLFTHGEPAMEFEFYDPQHPARLGRLFQGEHQILFQYGTARRLERIIDSAGRTISVVEGADGRLTSLTLEGAKGVPSMLLVAYEYDKRGNLIATRNAAGHGYAFAYDAENRLLERRGRKGFKFRFSYDAQGRCVHTTGDDGLYDVRLTYKVPSRVTIVQRADGGVWTYHYDATGGLTKIVDPLGGVQKFLRNEAGRVIAEVDPNGNTTRIIYDGSGAPVAKLTPFGHSRSLPEDPNAPDPPAHRVAANPAEYEYGRLLDLGSITLPDASSAKNLSMAYEARRLVATRPEETNLRANGNDFEVRPLGVRWWPEPGRGRIFNDFGKLVQQRDDWGRLRHWSYDPSGNPVLHIDFDGSKWAYDYGTWHLLRELTNAMGANVKYSHTTEGEVASFTDAGGTRSEYAYDLKDRLSEVRRHGAIRDRYTRDAAGNLVAKHASDGRLLLQFEIGPGNLPVKRILASGDEHTFEYDQSGRRQLAATKKDSLEFAYDELGNCILDQRNGQGVEHGFQGWGRPVESLFFGRFSVRYEHRAGETLISDPGGKKHQITFHSHGLSHRRFSNGSRETAQYDNQGRCQFKFAERKSHSPWSRRYHWSGEGELRRVEDNQRGETAHVYDAAHRLTRRLTVGGAIEEYGLDLADNLVRQPGIHEITLAEGNRLWSVNGLRVDYNDRNHVASRSTPAGPVQYNYDSRDQMVRVETPQGRWAADYDALGRRTRKIWGGQTTEYFWNADQLVAELNSDGRLRLYVYADPLSLTPLLFLDYDSIDAPPESCRRYFVFSDQIGTPCLIEDESGAEVWRAAIEPYGNAKVASGAKIEFNLRFPGHYFDPELGLHYNRFRYYDPRLGRYLQSDPWGIAGGYNLYAYRLNPLLHVDVRGLGEENLKAGKPCEDEEGNIRPARPGDEDQRNALAKAAGMEPEMLASLQAHCEDKGELLVVRDSKSTGIQYHDDTEGAMPKPHDVLLKSDADSGLVKRPDWDDPRWDKPDSGKAAMQANEAQLLKDGWTYGSYRGPNGEVHNDVLLSPDGKAVYGDHDLQGAYKPTTDNENAANYDKAGSNGGKYRDDLNNDAGLPPRMFQHGANDDYLGPDGKPLRQPGADEKFTVIDEHGNVTRINSTAELEQYYKDNGIPWPYQHYPLPPAAAAAAAAKSLAACPIGK